MSITPEDLAKITKIQSRILAGEVVPVEELREAINVARAIKSSRIAAAQKKADKAAKKPAKPISMDEVNELFASIKKDTKCQ